MQTASVQMEALRDQIRRIEAGNRLARGVLPFGVPDIDDRLPGGGLALGALHEVAGGADGALHGAAAALFAAGILARTHGSVLWVSADATCSRRRLRRRACIPTA